MSALAAHDPPVAAAPPELEPWRLEPAEVATMLATDVAAGVSAAEAAARLGGDGANVLDAPATVPRWRRFLGQFEDPPIHLMFRRGGPVVRGVDPRRCRRGAGRGDR